MQIQSLEARKILNSKKSPTIEVRIKANNNTIIASAPSGTSTGKSEVKPFSKKGIDFSIAAINALGKKFIHNRTLFHDFQDLEKIEEFIKKVDKTTNLELFGGNALYVLETAVLKAIAASQEKELWQILFNGKKPIFPRPLGNCIGGGKHLEQNQKTDFQEFLLLPETEHFFDSYFINLRAYKEAKSLLKEQDKFWKGKVTYENAFATHLDNESVLKLLQRVKLVVKDKFGISLDLGTDIAANSFLQRSSYKYNNFNEKDKNKILKPEEQVEYIANLIKDYNLYYIEDPFQEEDFLSFAKLLKKVKNCLIVGDDLTCTHLERVKKAIKMKAINALIVKPNQVGSLLETKKVVDFAKKKKIKIIFSHRSGETSDNALAHYAIGFQAPIIKTGILGKERFAKLHEILRIEREYKG